MPKLDATCGLVTTTGPDASPRLLVQQAEKQCYHARGMFPRTTSRSAIAVLGKKGLVVVTE